MINPQWGFNPIIIRMLFAVTLFQHTKQSGQIWGLSGGEWRSNGSKLVRYGEVVAKKVRGVHLMERNRAHEL
jgi:hypothetical protein